MFELFGANPGVVFFLVGGVCTIIAMLIGVLLIRRNSTTSSSKPRKSTK